MKLELSGQKFGRLAVIQFVGIQHNASFWQCRCDCGALVVKRGSLLKRGNIKSCGCLKLDSILERSTKHNNAKKGRLSCEYRIWAGIKKRCYCPKSSNFKYYGGSGISMDNEWKEDFNAFLRDVGKRPDGHSIERIDNNLGYSKHNCKWIPIDEQNKNRKMYGTILEHNNISKNITMWAKELGIHHNTLRRRLNKNGHDIKGVIDAIGLRKTETGFNS